MFNHVYTKISQIANKRSIIILLSLCLLLMTSINTINMPVSVPRINEISHGAGVLDVKLYYTSGEAYQLLERLQPGGRLVYLKLLTLFDFIIPFLYSLCLAIIINVIFGKAFPSIIWIQKLCLTPFLAGIFDYLENVSIIRMLIKYPKFDAISFFAGYFTLAKMLFGWVTLLLILFGLIYVLRKRGNDIRMC
ncbi:MAG TPA: hypothetical protein DDW50_01530 [Firmicutes bacterium]|jgi:hypothetical protein|nr:hypothetical protein [Bacillota bacterium]